MNNSYIYETQNYIILIEPKKKILNKNFIVSFQEENSELCIKKIPKNNENDGWNEIIYLYFFHKTTKIQNIIYIGSSSNNEIIKKICLEPKKIYICLSTIPSRANNINILKKNIDYLLETQTDLIEKIFITIPNKYIRFKETILPETLSMFEKYKKVEFIVIDRDYGPGSKYIGPLMHKYNEIKDNILLIIDDDRKYNKYLVQHFKIAHASFPEYNFMSGKWDLFFNNKYYYINESELDIYVEKESFDKQIIRGSGLGGFYGCAIYINDSINDFLNYNLNIIENVENAIFHDEGISLTYLKKRKESILFLKHKGCFNIALEPDALWKEKSFNRKKIENDIIDYTIKYKL